MNGSHKIIKQNRILPFKFKTYESLLACMALLWPTMENPNFESSNIAIVSVSLPEEHVNTAVLVSYKSPGFIPEKIDF